jgi:iron uptake system component EfeO
MKAAAPHNCALHQERHCVNLMISPRVILTDPGQHIHSPLTCRDRVDLEPNMTDRKLLGLAAGAAALCLLSACSAVSSSSGSAPAVAAASGIPITVSANACGTRWRSPSAGLQTFAIRNVSADPIDVALTNSQTGGVYAEIEALGPATTRPMQVQVGSGSYAFQCDSASGAPTTGPVTVVPGHVPDGQAIVPPDVADMLKAVTSDRTYVTSGLATVARQTGMLAAEIEAGNLSAARGTWLTAHLSYERLGSAYGMFGNYDDVIDGDPDGLPDGVNDPGFTGFYRIEYGLWHGQSAAQLTGPAQRLGHDVQALRTAYPGMALYPQAALGDLALRTHEILEHAIRFQLSGADDYGSGSTLATVDANLDATRAQLAMLAPLLQSRYPQLPSLDRWLDRLQHLIGAAQTSSAQTNSAQTDNGWTAVSRLTSGQREDLNAAAAQAVQLLAPIPVMFEASPLP